jgi:predicted nucleic-acid-binding Zn-ribbon protein
MTEWKCAKCHNENAPDATTARSGTDFETLILTTIDKNKDHKNEGNHL